MDQTNDSLPSSQGSNIIQRHLFLLIVVAIILTVLVIESRNMTAVGWAALLLLLSHVTAILVITYGGRSLVRSFFRRIHGHGHSHHHHGDDLETEGHTIGWARFYDLFIRLLFAKRAQKMMQSAVKLAAIQPGEKVLDVGCGTGTLALLAKQTEGQAAIFGIDAAPEMVERARQKAQDAHSDVQFQVGLVEDIQFSDGTFDVVMNTLMMHHLPPELQVKALAEMYRVLKPGGRVLIVDFEPPKQGLYKTFLTLVIGAMTSIDNTRIPPLVEASGFTSVKIGPTDTPIATYISGMKPTS